MKSKLKYVLFLLIICPIGKHFTSTLAANQPIAFNDLEAAFHYIDTLQSEQKGKDIAAFLHRVLAEDFPNAADSTKVAIYDRMVLAFCDYDLVNMDSAAFYIQKGIDLTHDKEVLIVRHLDLGQCYLHFSKLEQAELALKQALALKSPTSNEQTIAKIYVELSAIYGRQDKLNEGLALLEQGFVLANQSDDLAVERIVLNGKRIFFNLINKSEEANALLPRLIYLGEATNASGELVYYYRLYAKVQQQRGQLDSAEIYITKAMEVHELFPIMRYELLYNQADIHWKMGRIELAETEIKESIEGFRAFNYDETGSATKAFEVLAGIQLAKKDYSNAIISYQKCLKNAQTSGGKAEQKKYLFKLMEAYRLNGQNEKALDLLADYTTISDEIYQQQLNEELLEIETSGLNHK